MAMPVNDVPAPVAVPVVFASQRIIVIALTKRQ